MIWLISQLPAPFGGYQEPHTRVTGLFSAGHLPVKLPDYNNRLRVLVATYVTFSPNGTELLVNMGGEQVCMAPQIDSAPPTPYPATSVLHVHCHEADKKPVVNDIIVRCGNGVTSLAFPERCPGLVFFLSISFRTDVSSNANLLFTSCVHCDKSLHFSGPWSPHLQILRLRAHSQALGCVL